MDPLKSHSYIEGGRAVVGRAFESAWRCGNFICGCPVLKINVLCNGAVSY
jgi:hypothetical protein